MASQFRHAGHRLRRLGLSRPPCGARAGQARLPHPRRGAPAGTRRAICSRSAGSARSTRCRPICAIPARSRPRCATPTWSINLVGILFERGRSASTRCRPSAPSRSRWPAAAVGARMIHVSAIGADENSPSLYARTKAEGEKAVLAAAPAATILRPSIVFGPEDDFFNRFAALARMSPALPLIGGGETEIPAGVRRRCRAGDRRCGRRQGQGRHDLRTRRAGGADVREMMEYVLATTERRPPAGAAAVRARKAAGVVPAIHARSRC